MYEGALTTVYHLYNVAYVVLEADAKVSGQHHISHPHPSNRWTNLYTIADISTSTHEVYVPLVL